MSNQWLVEIEESGIVRAEPYEPGSAPPPDRESSQWGSREPATVVYINDSANTLDSQVREMMNAQAYVCEPGGPFAQDWEPLSFRMAASRDDVDTANGEVPSIITDDFTVQGAAGYHAFFVKNGQIAPIAFTDGRLSLPQVQETAFHELELFGNRTTGNWGPVWTSGAGPYYQLAHEMCDPLSGSPHEVLGVKIAAWVTREYLQGANKLPVGSYCSSRWFGETPRASGPKGRTTGGFWILRDTQTGAISNQFGGVDSQSVQWGSFLPPVPEYCSAGLLRLETVGSDWMSVHTQLRELAALGIPLAIA